MEETQISAMKDDYEVEEKKQAAADVLFGYSNFVMACIGNQVRPCDLRLHLMKEISGLPTSLKQERRAASSPDASRHGNCNIVFPLLVEKDPERAIPLFWAAINAGDRVDSALKDMAIVMKQTNRAEEVIEAIKSLRSRCSDQAQEALDNILLDLYKRCGRLDDQTNLLRHKLYLIQHGLAFNGKRTKTARSQGKKFQVSLEQEATRLLVNDTTYSVSFMALFD
ncbi:hypothetical protein K7X08_032899 [Anisodus acutangulus]|uniref:Uncharacterized protein n=1 Tax=Anisodus acutangulus TaxID=402998 RepID=A0A9Q1M297_9SOLA|nr:hypothetical protein K7X08_032899 [Anisodus acutangulus]